MKLRKSLAQREWAVGSPYNVRDGRPDVFESPGKRNCSLVATCRDQQTATSIAALPKLYAACLEVVRMDALRQFNELSETDFDHAYGLAKAAIDAANCADEPQP